jgi:OTU domain-containing protein 5
MFLKRIVGDGNCLFHAVSHQLYGTEKFHGVVRAACMDHMERQAQFYSQFVVGGATRFKEYIRLKRMDGVWGDDPEIQAICELYDRPVEVLHNSPHFSFA